MRTPLLIFSDTPSASSGLARINRDIATRVATHLGDVFKVGTIGYGAAGSSKLPFQQYSWTFNEQFIIHDLPEVWEDFAEGQRGIFMTIHDASRCQWLAHPESEVACPDRRVANFLLSNPFEKWGYFPVDANGPNGRFSIMLGECLKGYDRILDYSKWASKITFNTLGEEEFKKRDCQHLYHGIDTSVFYRRNYLEARRDFGKITVGREELSIAPDEFLVGIVATNQIRKDYGQAVQVFADFQRRKNGKARLWIHTDAMDRYWSIAYLLTDFCVPSAFVTIEKFSDDTMAQLYSACDITLGIGLGEGFGYPIAESLACGTPVIHGKYGGAAEWMPKDALVPVLYYRTEGIYGCTRPVFQTSDWLHMIDRNLGRHVELPAVLNWDNNWPNWEKWFIKGAEKFQCQSASLQAEQGSSVLT